MVQLICAQCGNPFQARPSRVKEGGKYCSLKCLHASLRGKKRKPFSAQWRKNMSLSHRKPRPYRVGVPIHKTRGMSNSKWKRDNVGYDGLHRWVKRYLKKPEKCENSSCVYPRADKRGNLMLKPKRLYIANISGEYKRDLLDWKYLCASCNHLDGIKIHPRFNL